jgi:hypothetical protein
LKKILYEAMANYWHLQGDGYADDGMPSADFNDLDFDGLLLSQIGLF